MRGEAGLFGGDLGQALRFGGGLFQRCYHALSITGE